MSTRGRFHFLRLMTVAGVVGGTCLAGAQQAGETGAGSSDALGEAVRELREQVRELQSAVAEMRLENGRMREESAELRRKLEKVRRDTAGSPEVGMETVASSDARHPVSVMAVEGADQQDQKRVEHAASLEEEYQLLNGKVDDQYQTKVESASKYRMRISGIVLMNLFSNAGAVDSIDVPTLAYRHVPGYSDGSFGATLRQSEIGFEVFGPRVAGAKTRADLQLDLGGGFLAAPNGVNAGLLRLRTGTMRFDWAHTSLIAGQDSLFFSPNSPTSFASLMVPALTYAGNLWGWIPQVRVEHHISLGEASSLTLQGGILDPVSGELPSDTVYRLPGPGEGSRRPAFGSRVGWTSGMLGHPVHTGFGGFYSRQTYGFDRYIDGWAGMADAEVPLSRQLSLSGELYRGRGIGGLYGATGRSVLFSGDPGDPTSQVRGLNTMGGWAQLKYQAASKVEFNAAFGMDHPYAADLRAFPNAQAYAHLFVARNSGGFGNVIYRPRSDLLFSAEYRHLRTYAIGNELYNADHINLMMGVLF